MSTTTQLASNAVYGFTGASGVKKDPMDGLMRIER